jgi:hypothetical protein
MFQARAPAGQWQARLGHLSAQTSALSGPDIGRPGPPRTTRTRSPGLNRTPHGGVAAGAFTPRWTRASRRRISPWSPLRGFAHGTGVRRRVHNTPTLGAPGARHPNDCTTDQAGGVWGGWPPPDHRSHPVGPGRLDLGPAPAQRDRPSETQGGRLGRRRRPSRTARKLIRATGQSRRAARGPGGKRWCQTGKEGGTGPRIRTRSAAPKSSTRITAATGSPLKRPPSPGSHRDGPEACSPGEVRAGARSLDGRGRGVQTVAKYGSEHPVPSWAPRARPWDRSTRQGCPVTLGLGAVGEGRIQGTRKSGAGGAARRPPWRLTGRPRGTGIPIERQHARAPLLDVKPLFLISGN